MALEASGFDIVAVASSGLEALALFRDHHPQVVVLDVGLPDHSGLTVLDRLKRFSKLGTIDLRIDYLRPSIAPYFIAKGELVRLGSRVSNTRMSFSSPDGKLLATGSGAYIVS